MQVNPFRALLPQLNRIANPQAFFGALRDNFGQQVQAGFYKKEVEPALYIYQIRSENRLYNGLLGGIAVEDYLQGRIKKHEHTRSEKEERQLQLFMQWQAMIKPVLLAYEEVASVNELIRAIQDRFPADIEFFLPEEEQEHRLWCVRAPRLLERLQLAFQKHVSEAFIADGHHRCSTAALLHQQALISGTDKNILCALFPSSQLEIKDFNRVVSVFDTLSPDVFLAGLKSVFEMEELSQPHKPEQKFELLMYMQQAWYTLRWKAEIISGEQSSLPLLDADLLSKHVLQGILGIENIREDTRIEYVGGPKGLDALRRKVDKAPSKVAFCLYPVLMDDLFTTVRAGQVMPPKSTWFEPRIKNGLVVYELGG